MSVSVSPTEFKFVNYDHATILRVAEDLAASLGLTALQVDIVVDETTPLARVSSEIDGNHVTLHAESGALEDTRKPRQLSETATATSLGRILLRVRDRLEGGFGEAPDDADLSLAQLAAWETYCVGRLARIGIPVNEQRWRYNFRNRHGFTDAGDGAFDRLWASDGLGWGELQAISTQAIGATAS